MRNKEVNFKKLPFIMIFFLSIGLMSFKSLKENSLEENSSNKFIGKSTECGPTYSIEPGSCYQNCETTFYVLWIPVSSSTKIAVPCE